MAAPTADTEILPSSSQAGGLPAGGPGLRVRSFGTTDQGSVRESNEDQFLIATLTKAIRIKQSSVAPSMAHCAPEEGHVFLVADGFGGAPAGEQASALAVEAIECFLANTLKWFFHMKGPETQSALGEFRQALRQADARIFEESAEHPECEGMGTTLTLAYSLGAHLFVAHAGDSRCYLLRDGELQQLTHDHTLAAALAERDAAPADEKTRRRLSHVITNAVGGREPGVRPEIQKHALNAGDAVILATDGLTRYVPDKQIADMLAMDQDPKTACEHLVAQALAAGGKDNITVIVARYEEM